MNKRLSYILLFCFQSLLGGCSPLGSPTVDSAEKICAFAINPENGLLKVRQYNEVNWRVKLLPRECDEGQNGPGTIHFIANISVGRSYEAGDVMMAGVQNYEEYADRLVELTFRLEEHSSLRLGGTELAPKLCHIENTYGLTQDRNIHILFADSILEKDIQQLPAMDLVIEDVVFGTGISHYRFDEKSLRGLPLLKQ